MNELKGNAGSQRAKPKRDVVKNALAGLIVIATLFLAFAPDPLWQGGVAPAEERRPGGDMSLSTLDGGSWTLGEHRGKVVLVNYWATWCPPCREETPALVRLANENASRGLEVVGITLDEDTNSVPPFVAEYRIPYPVLLPSDAASLNMMISALPTTLLYDKRGRLAKRYVGAVSESAFRADIELLLAEN